MPTANLDLTDENLLLTTSVIAYVEARVTGEIDAEDLARAVGFSLPHVREWFADVVGKPLGRYVLERRVANAARALVEGEDTVAVVAERFAFHGPDHFSRAVRRLTGATPSRLRAELFEVPSVKLAPGVVGPQLPSLHPVPEAPAEPGSAPGSGLVEGVRQVGFGPDTLTPFPSCLVAAAEHQGRPLAYDEALSASGAAYRLTWDEGAWNLGNVDVVFTYDDPTRIFRQGLGLLGEGAEMLWRSEGAGREEVVELVVGEIDAGRPVIALGVVGPPEACLVTGYRGDGDALVGWSYFQDNADLAEALTFDTSGHFVCGSWWDNPDTIAFFALPTAPAVPVPLAQVLRNALDAMEPRSSGGYARGHAAYAAWERAVLDDTGFAPGTVLQVLAERLMVQIDALDCLADGRSRAASHLERLAEQEPPEVAAPLRLAAEELRQVLAITGRQYENLGGWQRDEAQMRHFAIPATRRRAAALIRESAVHDARARQHLTAALVALES